MEKNNNECHGDHWEAVLSDSKKDFYDVLKTSLEDSTIVGSYPSNYSEMDSVEAEESDREEGILAAATRIKVYRDFYKIKVELPRIL